MFTQPTAFSFRTKSLMVEELLISAITAILSQMGLWLRRLETVNAYAIHNETIICLTIQNLVAAVAIRAEQTAKGMLPRE